MRILFIILEWIIPFLGIAISLVIYNSNSSISMKIIGSITKGENIGSITTAISIFITMVITSLTVFGTSPSTSIIKISKSKKTILFIGSALLSIFFGITTLLLLLFSELITSKYIFLSFMISIFSLWNYLSISLAIFYKNISEAAGEIEKNEKFLKKINMDISKIRTDISNLSKIINKK